MENQQPQQSQKPNQNQHTGHPSDYFIRPDGKIQITPQYTRVKAQAEKPEAEIKQSKPKKTAKTLEQQLADLDAKRSAIIEKKRKRETQKKIILGAALIKVMREYSRDEENRESWDEWKNQLKAVVAPKDRELFEEALKEIENKKI